MSKMICFTLIYLVAVVAANTENMAPIHRAFDYPPRYISISCDKWITIPGIPGFGS